MFNLYVISTRSSKNHLMFSFQDLLEGFVKYSEEGKEYGFTVHYVEDVDTDSLIKSNKVDGVFSIWGTKRLDKNIKSAVFIDDVHWWNEDGLNARLLLFNSVDLIFLPYYRSVMKYAQYYDFQKKFVSLYWWASDYCFIINAPWDNRKNKILLSGACSRSYALRQSILASRHDLLERLNHCGYSNFTHAYHGRAFLDYISNFKGMIATSATAGTTSYDPSIVHPLDYTLSKVFESLGCGCLSFLEKTEDFDDLGLVEYEHYIPITKDDFRQQFLRLHSDDAADIARKGQALVRSRHTTRDRIITIFKTLQERWL